MGKTTCKYCGRRGEHPHAHTCEYCHEANMQALANAAVSVSFLLAVGAVIVTLIKK